MQNVKLKHNLHLHFLVFIAGFTAILGELITIEAFSLVWYRMLIAGVLMFAYIKIRGIHIKISIKDLIKFLMAGVIIALHWITFFAAINESNVSIALAMFSTGAFFASFIEPLIYKRKIIWYEILFGMIVILGVFLITQSEIKYLNGILLGISTIRQQPIRNQSMYYYSVMLPMTIRTGSIIIPTLFQPGKIKGP